MSGFHHGSGKAVNDRTTGSGMTRLLSSRSLLTTLPAALALLGLVLLLAVTGQLATSPSPVHAQAPSGALVSNLGQTPLSSATSTLSSNSQERVVATQFTTGSADGYTLSSIQVKTHSSQQYIATTTASAIKAELWLASATTTHNPPYSKAYDLAVPAAAVLNEARTLTFTAPANATLAASTQYYLVVYTTDTTNLRLQMTSIDDEDDTPAAGWSIADGDPWSVLARSPAAGAWIRNAGYSTTALIQVNGAEAATSVAVSNFEQTASSFATSTKDPFGGPQEFAVSTQFTTGSASGGYTLSSIAVKTFPSMSAIATTTAAAIRAELWSAAASTGNPPEAKVYDLAVPAAAVLGGRTLTFTAPSTVTLAASTQYYLVVYTTDATNLVMQKTGSTAEDATPAAGWSITDGNPWYVRGRTPGSASWTQRPNGDIGLIQVSVYDTGAPANPALDLSALTGEGLVGVNFRAMTGAGAIVPAFDAATTGYRATVGYDTDHVRLTPTLADSGSSVKVGKAGTTLAPVTSGSASAVMGLDVGDNAFTVEVTAPDSSTRDYTVTVRRVTAGTEWFATLVPATIVSGGVNAVGCASLVSEALCGDILTDNSITIGSGSNSFDQITDRTNDTFVGVFASAKNTALSALNFCVSDTPYAIPSGTDEIHETSTDVGWVAGVPVSLSIGTSCDESALELSALTGATSTDGTNFVAMTGAGALVPAFAAATTGYRATVGNDITHVQLAPTLADTGSSVKVGLEGSTLTPVTSGTASAAIPLEVGDNAITVEVTAADSSTKDYTVTVRRVTAGSVWYATLVPAELFSFGVGCSNLVSGSECSSQLTDDSFTHETSTYSVTHIIDNEVDQWSVSIDKAATSELAALGFCVGHYGYDMDESTTPVLVRPTDVDWLAGEPVSLSIGTSCDESALELSALTGATSTDGTNFVAMTGAGALVPAFAAATTGYRATVGNDITHVQLAPTLADTGSSVKVGLEGSTLTPVTSGTASAAIPLEVGDNAITVEVTAADSSTRDYTVTVRRVPEGTEWFATLVPAAVSTGGFDGTGCTGTGASGCSSLLTDDSFTHETSLYSVTDVVDYDSDALFQVILSLFATSELAVLSFCHGDTAHSIVSGSKAVLLESGGLTAGVPASLSIGTSCAGLPPGFPVGLGVTPGATKLDLDWTAPADATSYDVHYTSSTAVADDADASGNNAANAWVDASHTGTTATHSITGLTNDTAYRVRVRGANAEGNGAWTWGTGTPKASTSGSTDATLSALVVRDYDDDEITLDPAFSSSTYAYTVDLDAYHGIDRDVIPTVNQQNATVKVNGTTVTSGTGSEDIVLAYGANRITVEVTAQAGNTRNYTITVNRAIPVLRWNRSDLFGHEGGQPSFTRDIFVQASNDISGSLFYASGTATVEEDLGTGFPQVFSMSLGDTYVSAIDIPFVADGLNEENETFTISIIRGTGYTLGNPARVTVTITDDDPPGAPGLSPLAAGDGALTASWTKPDGPVTGYQVRWKETAATDQEATTNGDPSTGWVKGGEMTSGPTSITGLTNGTAYDVQVRATDGTSAGADSDGYGVWSATQSDTPADPLSTNANLSGLTAATSTSATGDFAPLTLGQAFDADTTSYSADVGNDITHAKLTPTAADAGATVKVGPQGGTLTTVNSGSASAALSLSEGANAFTVRVSPEDTTAPDKDYTVTITRESSLPKVSLSASPNPVTEGSGVTVTATLSEALKGSLTIPLTISDDTAESGDHGTLASITISSGATTGTGTISTNQDSDYDNETFTVSLGTLPSGIVAGSPNSVRITITDDDTPPTPTVSLSASPERVNEGSSVTVTATLSAAQTGAVTIPLTITDDTAESGDHGTLTSITISGGATSGTGTISTNQDADTDHETFTVSLGTLPSGIEAGSPSSVRITIRDDDATAPGKVTGLSVAPGYGSLSLSWTAPVGDVTGYEVHYTTSDDWVQSPRHPGTEPTHTIGNLDPEFHRVRVRALNDHGPGPWVEGSGTPLPRLITVHLTASPNPVVEGGSVTLTATLKIGDRPTILQYDFFIPLRVNRDTSEEGDHGTVSGITIGKLQRSASVVIPTYRDGDRDEEFFTVTVGRVTEPVRADDREGSVRVRIAEREPPRVSLEASPNPVHEGKTVNVRLRLSEAMSTDLTVPIIVTRIDSEHDDHGTLGSITIPRGQTVGSGTIATTHDGDWDDETFTVALGSVPLPATAGSPRSVQVTIADQDVLVTGTPTAVSLTVSPNPVTEGNTVTLTATLNDAAPMEGTKVAFYVAGNGTNPAYWHSDYTISPFGSQHTTEIITIGPGQRTATATLDIKADGIAEGDETVLVQVHEWFIGTCCDPQATLTIKDPVTVTGSGQQQPVGQGGSSGDQGGSSGDQGAVQAQQGQPNQAPTVAASIADATIVSEGGTHEVSLSEVFDDGDALTISAASSDDAVATASVAADYSSLTVNAQARGSATVTVTADDGNGGTVEDSFTVKVKAAPVVVTDIADTSGLTAGDTRDITLSAVFSDPDGDSLSITAASSNEAVATVSVASDGSSLTVSGVAEGAATVTVTAQDSDGNRVSDAFQVSVIAP